MIQYKASVQYGPGLEEVEFETDGNPVQYLWEHYGMSSYIASVLEVTPKGEEIVPRLLSEDEKREEIIKNA